LTPARPIIILIVEIAKIIHDWFSNMEIPGLKIPFSGEIVGNPSQVLPQVHLF